MLSTEGNEKATVLTLENNASDNDRRIGQPMHPHHLVASMPACGSHPTILRQTLLCQGHWKEGPDSPFHLGWEACLPTILRQTLLCRKKGR
jgi:hypothetical protein